ncbi:MAG: hypothetical protein JWO38_3754 [Gemmataceae bacterium]|nr:hypothetical protein [Gemmataceae bacterium]
MAEPTTPPPAPAAGSSRSPALPSTADAVPYVPVSWMAVSAMGTAALFVLILLVGGYGAWREKRPLLMDWALIFPVAAVVLSFAARRIIRNAEGTRTGELFGVELTNLAWWTALVGGLGYAAYLVAIETSIRQDAKGEVQRWADNILKGDDPAALTRAFHRTRDPNERALIGPDNRSALEARYRNEFIGFEQCDLVSLVKRNRGACQFSLGGMRDWAIKPSGVECTITGTVLCPEGAFPVNVALRGIETGTGEQAAGRQWQIMLTPAGYLAKQQARLTPYGWAVAQLEMSGSDFGRKFITISSTARDARAFAYLEFARAETDPAFRPLTPTGQFVRAVSVGAPAGLASFGLPVALAWLPGPPFAEITADRLFRLPGGGEPSVEQKQRFAFAWTTTGISRPGERLRDTTDVHEQLVLTDSAVEFRLPVEIPLPTPQGVTAAARGRVVIACTDPAVLAEVRKLRQSADPVNGVSSVFPESHLKPITWKLVRIESDLQPVTIRPQGGPGGGPPGAGPGGPPGAGPGGPPGGQ